MIDKGICDKGFIWNPSNCDCECDKLCDAIECLDYKICNSRKRLIDKLVEECRENIDGNKIFYNDYENFGTVYIVLFAIAFLIIIGINSTFIYFIGT